MKLAFLYKKGYFPGLHKDNLDLLYLLSALEHTLQGENHIMYLMLGDKVLLQGQSWRAYEAIQGLSVRFA